MQIMLRMLSTFFLFNLSSGLSLAQDAATGGGVVRLIDTTITERTVEGELDACEYTYFLGYPDYIYRNGDVVGLRGSVSIKGFNKNVKQPFVILKVTGYDTHTSPPTLFKINYAYLSGNGVSYAKQEFTQFTCEDGGFCSGYTLLDKPDIGMILSSGFEINYNRTLGSSDVSVPIRLLRDKPAEAGKFSECVLKGMEMLVNRNQ